MRLLCTGRAGKGESKLSVGLRLGKDRLSVAMPVESDASGAVYECTARVAGDEIDRPGVPRFKGKVVQGNKVRCAVVCACAAPCSLPQARHTCVW